MHGSAKESIRTAGIVSGFLIRLFPAKDAPKKKKQNPEALIKAEMARHLRIIFPSEYLPSEASLVTAKPVPDAAKVIPKVKTENII